jgi:hypothetical protein
MIVTNNMPQSRSGVRGRGSKGGGGKLAEETEGQIGRDAERRNERMETVERAKGAEGVKVEMEE